MKKVVMFFLVALIVIPCLFANSKALGLGGGYGGYFIDDLTLYGPQVSLFGQNDIANDMVLFSEASFIFPMAFKMNGITIKSDLFDSLWGMGLMLGVGYNIPDLGNIFGIMIGAGINYHGLYYNLAGSALHGNDHLLGIGALANFKVNFNSTLGLILSMKYAYSFVDFASTWTPSTGDVTNTDYVNGSTVEGKLYLSVSWE